MSVKISCVRQAVMILDHTQSCSIAVSLGQTTCLRAAGSSPAGRTTETSLGHPEGLLTTNDSQPGEDPPPWTWSGPRDLRANVAGWSPRVSIHIVDMMATLFTVVQLPESRPCLEAQESSRVNVIDRHCATQIRPSSLNDS